MRYVPGTVSGRTVTERVFVNVALGSSGPTASSSASFRSIPVVPTVVGTRENLTRDAAADTAPVFFTV